MKRTTISIPDDLAAALEREARRCGVSVSQIARDALNARLGRTADGKRHIPFAGIGQSGYTDTAERFEEILAAEWLRDLDRDR